MKKNEAPKLRKKLTLNKEKRSSSKEEDNLDSNVSEKKDEPIDFNEIMKKAQEKMDKVYTFWAQIKDDDGSEEREINQEFNNKGSKFIDSFGAEIQSKLENISKQFDSNQNKREQLKNSDAIFNAISDCQ